METTRYVLALLTIVTLPPAIGYWFLMHPLARHWRRLGAAPAFTAGLVLIVLIGSGMWRLREPLLRVRYDFEPPLAAVGVLLYLAAAVLEVFCRRHLKFRILAGFPELSRRGPGQLLTEGIYARVRHPRYLAVLLGMSGVALFVNYLGVYLLLAASVPVFYLLVLLEERELAERFGSDWAAYSRRVPRFLPRRERAP